ARGAHHHDLVHVPDDVVLDEVVRRVVRERDAVAAAAGVRRLGGVDVGVAQDGAEARVDGHAGPVLEVRLDVLDPAVGGVGEPDVALAASATKEIEVLDPGVFHRGDHRAVVLVGEAHQLRRERGQEIDVEGRAEAHRAPADRLDLHDLAHRPVRTGEPGARDVARWRLRAPLGDGGIGELVDHDDLPRGETGRDGGQAHAAAALDRVCGEVGGLGELEPLRAYGDEVGARADGHL